MIVPDEPRTRRRRRLTALAALCFALAGCESQPTNTLPDGSSGTKPAEVVQGKGKKGGEAKSNKNTDLKDLIPKKDR